MLKHSERIAVKNPAVLRQSLYARIEVCEYKDFDITVYDDRTKKDFDFRINFVRNGSEFNISIYKLDGDVIADISYDDTEEAIALYKYAKMSIAQINQPLFFTGGEE
jgi:hypothetical protein